MVCANEVSAILADIRKDILYCDQAGSQRRRSTQTVLHTVATELCRVMAPILSFTSEEAYGHIPGKKETSVFLAGFPEVGAKDEAAEARFGRLLEVRSAVSKQLELARREKTIGKSLEAKVVLAAEGPLYELLQEVRDELAAFFIVSQVELVSGREGGVKAEGLELRVSILPAAGEKCVRCWIYYEDLGSDPDHPQLCRRCTEAVRALG